MSTSLEVLPVKDASCSLCHKPCDGEVIHAHGENFCCTGCKSVYEIISGDVELFLPKKSDKLSRLAYLDLEEIQKQLLIFQTESHARVRFKVPSIHCSSCVLLLEQLPQFYPDILQSRVHFPKKEVDILYQKSLPLSNLVGLMIAIGYEPIISLEGQTEKKEKNSLGLKIAVAGFCFGNAMLLSLPEYLDTNFLITENFQLIFRAINVLLSIPVVFYAASDYFKSAWGGIKKGFFTIDVPIALGVLTLFSRSLYEIMSDTGPGYVDSLTGLIFLLLIGRWYQQKTYDALSFDRDYKSYFPMAATKLEAGKETPVPIKDLKIGDRVLVYHQELIPCDAMLISPQASLDYSFVSGESEPVMVNHQESVYAGGRNNGPRIEVELQKRIDMSYLSSLWDQESLQQSASGFRNLTDRISKYFTWAVLAIALLSGVFWAYRDASQIVTVVTSILIVACPCALALALPFTFGHTLRIFGKHGFYVRNAEVIEKLKNLSTIVFDKTGTLTYQKARKVSFVGRLDGFEKELVASLIINSSHPLSRIIADYLSQEKTHPVQDYQEVTGKGAKANVRGKVIKLGSANFVEGNFPSEKKFSQVFVSVDGQVRGYFKIKHSFRQGLGDLLKSLRRDYKLLLLSGDKEQNHEVLDRHFQALHFNLKPIDKLRFIASEQANGKSTAMVGDGLNDAGALKKSDVGIAVADEIHQFSPSCHAILSGEKVTDLPKFLRFARKSVFIVKVAFVFSFLYNILGLSFAVSGHLSPLVSAILMPVSSVTVVGLVVLLTTLEEKKTFKFQS